MMESPYKIALIVPYFGPLPPYFPVWLESAKANPDLDFFLFTDQEISIDAPNFRVTQTTLDAMRERFERKINRSVSLSRAYKLCDYKVAYGLFFEEELRGYDFWGYCDIDLVFGRVRHFLTDETLENYDRLYTCGHLCIYRNNEKMRRAFELPGSCFTLDEMFGAPHVGTDENLGMDCICAKNQIPWYTKVDFANLSHTFKTRLQITGGQPNYPVQAFYWLDGRAFQRYVDAGQIHDREVAYIHWLARRPVPERLPAPGEAVVVTAQKLLVRSPQDLTPENMSRWNPPASRNEVFVGTFQRRARKFWAFVTGSLAFKKIWLKTAAFWLLEIKLKKQSASSSNAAPRRSAQSSGNPR